MNLSPQWLDQLRGRLTLSSIIGRSVRVEKAGREFKACCPFHNEKTPSFTINDVKGFYHCFGCGAHGDAIRWMTDHRGLGFMDAVKELASEAGMEVPAPDPQAAKRAEKRDSLYDVCAAAQNWFAAQLHGVGGAQARDYLEKRGISAETQAKFGFGFAPDGRGNIAKALDVFATDKLVEAGLLISVDGKTPYDRFRGRLMIPIRDARGRTIAWGGRILGAGEPKYLNSPDTPLFDKGRTLYNIDNAAAASRQTGRLIVVEGYMDAIALAQAGFEDVVAPLGTALTEEQIGMAWKMADRPILCLDGDNAGQKAAMRAAQRALPMLRSPLSMKFTRLPPGRDPDDILRENGPAVLQRLLDQALTLPDFIWRVEVGEIGLKPDADTKAGLKNKLLEYTERVSDSAIKQSYRESFLQKFAERFGFKSRFFKKVVDSFANILTERPSGLREQYIRAALLGLSRYPSIIRSVAEELATLPIQNTAFKKMRDDILSVALEEPDIEMDMFEQAWVSNQNINFEGRTYNRDLAFTFYHKLNDKKKAESDLFLVINALKQDFAYEKALTDLRAQFDNGLDSKTYEEHQTVQKQRDAIRDQLKRSLEMT